MSEPSPRRAKRSLGQNFLVDPNLQRKIVAALGATPNDEVVEVGPGRGALTHHLIGTVGRLVLIELDNELAAHWTAEAADLNYPEEWLQPEPFAKHFVSYGAVKAAYYDIYDEEEYEIWVSPKIGTAATRYDKESGKHLIFVGNTLEEMKNTWR